MKVLGFYKTGPHYATHERRIVKFLQPAELVEVEHNAPASKRGRLKRPAWAIIARGSQRYIAVNKGHEYKVEVSDPGADDFTVSLLADDEHALLALEPMQGVVSVRANNEEIEPSPIP